MQNIENNKFIGQLGSRQKLFSKVHKLILSLNKDISFRIFPIYVIYFLEDKTIAIIYYRGKFIDSGSELDLGLNLSGDNKIKEFKDAEYMKYPGITYSVKLKNIKNLNQKITKVIRLIK